MSAAASRSTPDPALPAPEPPPEDAGLAPLFPLRAGSLWALLAALYTCYLAAGLLVPIVFAGFLALCGNPLVATLQKWRLPRGLGALLVLLGALLVAALAANWLLEPALAWLQRAPTELREHLPRLRELMAPLKEAGRATQTLQNIAETGPPVTAVQVQQPASTLLWTWLSTAPQALATLLAVLILVYFLMVYGERMLQQLVSAVPGWGRKRATVELLRALQSDVSRYVLTISLINTGLGLSVALALWAIGFTVENALLWGMITGLLNFAPYVGPLVTALGLTLAGLTHFSELGQALLPVLAQLLANLIESQWVTPLVLGQRMAISPVILVLWLFLWGWIWGVPGMLLAVPLLVCIKLACSRLDALKGWARLLEP